MRPVVRLTVEVTNLGGGVGSDERLIRRLEPAVRRLVERSVLVSDDRDDAVQDGLLAVLVALPSFRGESSLPSFSTAVALRSTLAKRRARQRYIRRLVRVADLELPLLSTVRTPEDETWDLRRRAELRKLLRTLPDAQVRALLLHFVFDFSFADVAKETGVSINTVRRRLHLARRRLRAGIEANQALWELFGEFLSGHGSLSPSGGNK